MSEHSITVTGLTRLATSALLCGVLSGTAMAEDVTLRSADGSIDLTGELLAYDGTIYTIDSLFGELKVEADRVECIGDACPGDDMASLRRVTWNVSLWGQRRAFTEHVERLAELVSARTDGQFRLNISYGGLSPSRENLEGISNGAFEMAQFCAGYHPEKNPSITVLELPFLGVSSMEQEAAVSQALYQHPAVVEDLARWNATLLMPTPQPQYNVAGVDSLPMSLASFEALTIRATGGTSVALSSLGAEVVNLPAPDVADALRTREVNAVAFAPHAHMAFNTIDSALWWITNLNPGTANCPVVVNTDALEELPEVYREALLSSVDESIDHFIDHYTTETMAAWDVALVERDIIQITFDEDILSSINLDVATPAALTWISENTERGLPAEELYQLVLSTIEEN